MHNIVKLSCHLYLVWYLFVFTLISKGSISSNSDSSGESADDELVDEILTKQIASLVNEFNRSLLVKECGKNWDKFYKRNGTRFFKVTSDVRQISHSSSQRKMNAVIYINSP